MSKILIKNGTVITGEKRSRFKSDVLIDGDRIAAIERRIHAFDHGDCEIVDARDRIVCPGFVDPHSHADLTIHRADHPKVLEPLVRQGITTFVGGNCGMSMAPLSDRNFETQRIYLEGFTARSLDDVTWKNTAGFMEHIENNGLLLNCALLAPHGLLRIDAMGMEMRHAGEDEIKTMVRSLNECMEAGCIGMSTGLQYMPGLQSDIKELIVLGKVLRKYDGIYTSHLRTYMNDLPRAMDELATVARTAHIRAQCSHIFWVPDLGFIAPVVHAAARLLIKVSRYWTPPIKLDGDMEKQLEKLDRLRRSGIAIGTDSMPSSTTFTHLFAYLPPWVLLGDRDEVQGRFTDPRIRKRILRDIEEGDMQWPHTGKRSWSLNVLKLLGWSSTIIMSVVSEENRKFEGKSLEEIGQIKGKHPFDAMCDILIEEEGRVLVFSALGEPEDNFTERSIFAAISDPETAICTDTILLGFGMPSYLFYGAFPKFFGRYVREMQMVSLETAVRKATALPAEHFGLNRRGVLREGNFADIVVFDPFTIAANCSFTNPRGVPTGMDHVFINGQHVLNRGTLNIDPLPGRLLKG